ncbi:MAG: Gfo/Idh/MocA family oxidoreductase [bacterium]|nr:Gfo/Idh/MocA family oxidoreductase [bacterium]
MNTPNASLRAAVVGAGYLGRFHAQKYAALPGVDLVAIVDVDLDRARAVAAETGAPCACRLLAEVPGRLDAASVVVPNEAHFTATAGLLERGIHVLIEKPVTGDVGQASQLEEMAAARGLVLQPGFLERFNPAIRFLREHAPRPRFVESHRLGGYKARATDVDVVMDLMIHDIDIALYLVDAPVLEVRASGTAVLTSHVDIANARLEFEGGATANLTASRVSLKDMRKVRVFSDGGYAAADCATRENVLVLRGPDGSLPVTPVPQVVRHEACDPLLEEISLSWPPSAATAPPWCRPRPAATPSPWPPRCARRLRGRRRAEGGRWRSCADAGLLSGYANPWRFIMRRILFVPLLLALLAPVATFGADSPLQGKWIPVRAEMAGLAVPAAVLETMNVTFAGDGYTVTVGPQVDTGRFKLTAGILDFIGTGGPNKGKTIPAIYVMAGDTLRICYDLAGKDRPLVYKTAPKTRQFSADYLRKAK